MKFIIFLFCLGVIMIVGGKACSDMKQNTHKRYFMIGYVGDPTEGIGLYNGGEDFISDHYPNLNELVSFISHKHPVKNIRIIGVSEQTKIEHDIFWKNVNK